MSTETGDDFAALMERMRSGCQEAARELFERYSPAIRRVVRRRLHQRLRTQYDSVDFLQAVWASFFAVPADRWTFATPDELAAYLARLAGNKVVEVFRNRLQTDKHNLNMEVPLAIDDESAPVDPDRAQPTPSQVAMANERWQLLLRGQPEGSRRILELLRQGYNHTEIAARLGRNPKAIQRLLRRLEAGAHQP